MMNYEKMIQYQLAKDAMLRLDREHEQRNCIHVWNEPQSVLMKERVVVRVGDSFGWEPQERVRQKRVCRKCGKEIITD
jgi:hypothetical protein